MPKQRYDKFVVATMQLVTAVELYEDDGDRFSVITLAGAADAILMQLALRRRRISFADIICQEWGRQSKQTPSRGKVTSLVNNSLGINAIKHMDSKEDDHVTMDAEVSARFALLKALENFRLIAGEDLPVGEDILQRLRDGCVSGEGGT